MYKPKKTDGGEKNICVLSLPLSTIIISSFCVLKHNAISNLDAIHQQRYTTTAVTRIEHKNEKRKISMCVVYIK